MSRDDLTPPLQISAEIVEVEGKCVVVGVVPPTAADRRPVYVTMKGVGTGSYLRSGDGDRRMTQDEVGLLFSNRSQPRYDEEPVLGTSLADLDADAVTRTLQRVRRGSTALARADDLVALRRIGVLTAASSDAPVTLAGLLTFGAFPQERFPQLMVTIVVHPADGGATRFLDNVTVRGSIPELLAASLDIVRRNLAARAVTTDTGRFDRLEFPLLAVREALVNALMHRDYSGITRGSQVQVELHPDRLEIRSPGGIYGGIAVDDLGEEGVSSSRNAVLASLLSDAYVPGTAEVVAENRSSGVPTMITLARESGLPRPEFRSSVSSFVVTMNRSQLLGPEVRAWIARMPVSRTTPAHEIALAMLRNGAVTNEMLRQWGVDRIESGQVLRGLVAQGVAVKEGGRRYATYVLDPSAVSGENAMGTWDLEAATDAVSGGPTQSTTERVASALRDAGRDLAASELEALTGLKRSTVVKHVRKLVAQGMAKALEPARSPRQRYRWLGHSSEQGVSGRPGVG